MMQTGYDQRQIKDQQPTTVLYIVGENLESWKSKKQPWHLSSSEA